MAYITDASKLAGTLDGDRLPAMSSTKKGGVPATGTPANKFLRDDATWQTVSGTGTVTDVSVTTANGVSGTVATSTGVPAGPLDVPFITQALLVTAGNTGTCQLRFRSETTAVTELLAGVVMVVERLI